MIAVQCNQHQIELLISYLGVNDNQQHSASKVFVVRGKREFPKMRGLLQKIFLEIMECSAIKIQWVISGVGENNEEQGSDKAALAAWPRYLSPSASLSELLLLLEDDAQIMMI